MTETTVWGDTALWQAAVKEAHIDRKTTLEGAHKEAVELLGGRLSRRSRGALIRNDFVCGAADRVPPLAQLAGIHGRGGGEVALKLYLALLWVSAGGEHQTDFEAAHWSQVLALPPDTGPRRIRRALNTLQEFSLIRVKERKGKAPIVTLLHDSGSKKAYTLPNGHNDRDRYFSLAPDLWLKGLIQGLSTAGVAMLLILSEEARGKDRPQWWSPRVFQDRFHISSDTRTRGAANLRDAKLVVERSLVVAQSPSKKSFFTPTRRRKAYLLVNEARQPSPEPDLSSLLLL